MSVPILGAGVTGLSAAYRSGLAAYEAAEHPGGICSSYYVRPGSSQRLYLPPEDGDAYRFEIGGGHWIFGGDPDTLEFIETLAPSERFARRSSVLVPGRSTLVPYPIQNHLRYLPEDEASSALREITTSSPRTDVRTMEEWIDANFGRTLAQLFFHPFHELYTAGLWTTIAPQDAYKSPLDVAAVVEGASHSAPEVGYNTTFRYPKSGLDGLARTLASAADVRYGKRVVEIDTAARTVVFSDGDRVAYDEVIATLPLNRLIELTGAEVRSRPDPYTSVLVVNVGAKRAARCPDDHWVYVARSDADFHRVGFYSNVDASFVPASARDDDTHVSIYVESAFVGGTHPDDGEIQRRIDATIAELRSWEWIDEVDVVDPTWIDVAYTWSWPGSTWVDEAVDALRERGVHAVGRYARWTFQGIADSIRDGLEAGRSFAR
jgi:protoporphyrinogen oxidase